jgi:hypothetical protein
MQTFSNVLLLAEIVLFSLLVGNIGNLLINLLIKDNANS